MVLTTLLQVVDAGEVELLRFGVLSATRVLRLVPRLQIITEHEALVEEGLISGRTVSGCGSGQWRCDGDVSGWLLADVVVSCTAMKVTPWSVVCYNNEFHATQ